MGVDEVDATGGAARSPGIREQEERQQSQEPRPSANVPWDPMPVREPEVRERRGRDDLDLGAGFAQVLHRVAHEGAGDVVRLARVRRRQDEDAHQPRAGGARRPKTTGTATASTANT